MSAILIKIPVGILRVDIAKLIVKSIWKFKEPRIDKTTLKKMSELQDLHYQISNYN